MAGIDHTIIAFHNGKLMRHEGDFAGNQYVSLIPFKYTRDGVFAKLKIAQKSTKS